MRVARCNRNFTGWDAAAVFADSGASTRQGGKLGGEIWHEGRGKVLGHENWASEARGKIFEEISHSAQPASRRADRKQADGAEIMLPKHNAFAAVGGSGMTQPLNAIDQDRAEFLIELIRRRLGQRVGGTQRKRTHCRFGTLVRS